MDFAANKYGDGTIGEVCVVKKRGRRGRERWKEEGKLRKGEKSWGERGWKAGNGRRLRRRRRRREPGVSRTGGMGGRRDVERGELSASKVRRANASQTGVCAGRVAQVASDLSMDGVHYR